jgi:hypothetical protein
MSLTFKGQDSQGRNQAGGVDFSGINICVVLRLILFLGMKYF